MKYLNFKLLMFFAALALAIPPAWAGTTVTDEITVQKTGIDLASNNTGYQNFSNLTDASNAVYKGKIANGGTTDANPSIQLRSNNSDAGIITTASGGKVKSVTITFNSYTNVAATNGRTVLVFGKNTAYESPSDLFESSLRGTQIGSISSKAQNFTATISGDYEYIGIRSSSGGLYIDKIEITWEVPDAGAPYITVDDGLTINDPTGDAKTGTLTATLTNGQGAITAATNPSDKWSWNNNTVTFNGNELGAEGTVTFSSTGATNVTADLEYNYTGPLYIIGTVNGRTDWAPNNYVQMERGDDGLYTVTLTTPSGDQGKSWISFTKRVANDNDGGAWNYIAPYRFSPAGEFVNTAWDLNDNTINKFNDLDFDAGHAGNQPIKMEPGTYTVTINPETNKFKITKVTGPVTYEKITSTADLSSGKYLIVYETGSVALDGSLETLDKTGNTQLVEISNDQITTSDEIYFTYDATNKTLKSASGFFIGHTGNKNTLDQSETAGEGFTNTITFDSNGNALINVDATYQLRFNKNSDQARFRYFSGTSQQLIQLYKEYDPNQVATPTITPGTGTYTEAKSVTITCATEGADIYYTTDGETTPDASSTPYTGAITVDHDMTIKAIAIKDGRSSNVAIATYTINLPEQVDNIAAVNALNSGKDFVFNNMAVVVYHKGNQMWIQDYDIVENTVGGALVYNQSGFNFDAKDVLKKGWTGTTNVNSGNKQIINLDAEKDGTKDPVALKRTSLAPVNEQEYVLLEGVTISDDLKTMLGEQEVLLYPAKFQLFTNFEPKEGFTYNVKGIFDIYNNTYEIYPLSIDLVKQNPNLEFNPTSVSVYAGVTDFPEPTLTKPEGVTVSYASGNADVVTVDANTGVVTIVGPGNATITATSTATDFYTAGEATYAVEIKAMEAAGLSYGETPVVVTATDGDTEVDEPVLNNPNNLTGITYSSSDTNVATVDAATGEVTVVGPGTATITASYAGNETDGQYQAGSASYTIKVNHKPLTVTLTPESGNYTVGQENPKVKVEITNVVGELQSDYALTYKVGEEVKNATVNGPDAEGYITLPNDKAVTYTLTVTALDDREDGDLVEKTGTYAFTAAPAITFDLDIVHQPEGETYHVGDVVKVKATNIKNVIILNDDDMSDVTYMIGETPLTPGDDGYVTIPSDEVDEVTLTVTVEDLYEHAADATQEVTFNFVAADAINITLTADPEAATYTVGDVVNVTVNATGTIGNDVVITYKTEFTRDVEQTYDSTKGIDITSNEAGDVTLTVNVYDGYAHQGAGEGDITSKTATYKFEAAPAIEIGFDPVSGTEFTVGEEAKVKVTVNGLKGDPEDAIIEYKVNGEETTPVEGYITLPTTEPADAVTVTVNVIDGYEHAGADPETGITTATATYTVAPQPVVATPVITPNGGSYSAAQTVNITCDTPDAVIYYSTNGTNWTEGSSLTVSENCTVYAKATKAGSIDSQVAQATFKFEIPVTPTGPTLKGYYQIKNNANGEYVNVLGRKTLRFTANPADQAGSVIYVETSDKGDGQVQSLRSQAADLQGYADRAMRYVPEVVQLVVNKLHAAGSGEVLGEHGYDEIMAAFNESFDYHLYVEQGDKGYRLYGKTPSMQPVVDFYRSHKDQVDAKLPMIEGFINEAIDKILQKTNGSGQSILVDYDIHEVWQRMGAENSGLTEPADDAVDPANANPAADLAFYQEVLNDKDNVWNFAYQSVMIYWEKLKNHPKFQAMKPQLGEFANYIDKLEQIRPNAKYYVIQTDGKPDYVSDGNALILNKEDCTYWTLEPRTEFTVNFPADTKYGDQYVTTLYTDFAYKVPEGVTAYKVTAVDEQGLAQIEALTSPIAAQTPVLLMAQANGRAEVAKTLTIAESGNAVDGNLLVGPDFLIERDSILTPQVAAVFALAKTYVSEDFYNNYVKQYEHLMFRNSGTVNNKYFWGLSEADLLNYCSYKEDGMDACDVRSLDVADGKIAFINNLTVATNKAFLINKDFDVINLAVVEKPVITPVPENPYTAPVEVTITCATEEATILYTTDGGENWTEYTKPFTLNETTTVQAYATKAGLGDSEKTEEVEYVIELPVATPVVTPEGGSYGSAQTVRITCDTPDAVISYSTDGGKTWTEYTEPFTVDTDCTITVKAEKTGMTPSETSVSYVFEIPESPIEVPALKGYFYIKNNGTENYANVQGRKTLHFTSAPEDQAGTVFYVETNENGQVQSLRSQAADLQGYADRAMNYVPKVVQIVANKLNATGSGNILGEHGYDEIMAAFNASFDHHLYVEPTDKGENVYRLYAKTPSMQPVVDFYRSHKDQVDAKLPMLEGFINDAFQKILNKTNGIGSGILEDYDIHKVWKNMGGADSGLTEPVDDATDLAFYQEVLNNKDNVWNFAYQSVMIYWNNLMENETFKQQILPMLGNDAQYLENLTQIRPNTKYYVIENGNEPDYVSENNVYITGKQPKTYWTLEPRTTFDVNIPEELPYRGQYVTTLYTDFAYTLPPEGVTAYKVTGISDKGVVDIKKLEGPIAAQTPVLLMANEAGVKTLTIAESGNAVEGNLLVGPDFLIERDSILTDQIAALFGFAKDILNEEFYENNVKQYEHLMFRTAGTVNNKYFWGLSEEDLITYCLKDGEDDTDIRSLGVENKTAAFCEHWTVEMNKAFLIDETKELETLVLPVKDITRDGIWDIEDATALIDILLTLPARPYEDKWDYEAADFNLDGGIDILDATNLINYLLYK